VTTHPRAKPKGESLRKSQYLLKATRRFLHRTKCISPLHAVEQEVRTLEQWTDVLREEYDVEQARKQQRRQQQRLQRKNLAI
jgi:hypothetical protein